MDHIDILPDARSRKRVLVNGPGGVTWIKVFCINCGGDGGGVPVGMALMADEVFYRKVAGAVEEEYGHELTDVELLVALDDPASILHKLARDAPKKG